MHKRNFYFVYGNKSKWQLVVNTGNVMRSVCIELFNVSSGRFVSTAFSNVIFSVVLTVSHCCRFGFFTDGCLYKHCKLGTFIMAFQSKAAC